MRAKGQIFLLPFLCLCLSFLLMGCANKVEVRAKGEMQMGIGVGQR